MPVITKCPSCKVELTIPDEAGSRRLRCPQCATRFYPGGGPEAGPRNPASSILAQPAESPRVPKRAKVPPSSGQHPASVSGHAYPSISGDLRDMLDIPLLGDDEPPARPPSRMPAVADASALFADDPAPRARKPPAEARRQSRRCPSCGTTVLGGMSLCGRCGLDLDTGVRHEPEELLDDAPPPLVPASSEMPPAVLIVGLAALIASVLLTFLAIVKVEGIGRVCLSLVCLFGTFASIEFLRGRTAQYLVIALMLGGVVDIMTLIIMPVVVADATIKPAPESIAGTDETDPGETDDIVAPLDDEIVPLAQRVDMSAITSGVVFLVLIGLLLVAVSLPGVKSYFHRRKVHNETGFISP